MKSVFVTFLVATAKAVWPKVEPFLEQAAVKLLAELIDEAKAAQLPEKWKLLEGPLAAIEGEIQKLLPAPAA